MLYFIKLLSEGRMGVDEKSAIIKIVDEAKQINIHDASNMLLHYQAAKKNPL